jgi:hypothetical protein
MGAKVGNQPHGLHTRSQGWNRNIYFLNLPQVTRKCWTLFMALYWPQEWKKKGYHCIREAILQPLRPMFQHFLVTWGQTKAKNAQNRLPRNVELSWYLGCWMTYKLSQSQGPWGFQWMVDLWVLSHIISKLLWHDKRTRIFVRKSWKGVVVVVHVM